MAVSAKNGTLDTLAASPVSLAARMDQVSQTELVGVISAKPHAPPTLAMQPWSPMKLPR